MARQEKEIQVGDLSERFRNAQSVILADFSGLDVEADTELRRRLRNARVEYRVIKNTLGIRAARAAGLERLEGFFAGPTAIAFGERDPVAPARILVEFAKERNLPRIKGGYWNGQVLEVAAIKTIASLPSKEVLQAQFLATLQGPICNFMALVTTPVQQFLVTLSAVAEKRKREREQ